MNLLHPLKLVTGKFLVLNFEHKVIIIEALILLIIVLFIIVAWNKYQKVIKQVNIKIPMKEEGKKNN